MLHENITHSRTEAAAGSFQRLGKILVVSTHSRAEAAADIVLIRKILDAVSTHSRPKVTALF